MMLVMVNAGQMVLTQGGLEWDRVVSVGAEMVVLEHLGQMTRVSFDIGVSQDRLIPTALKPYTATYRFCADGTTYEMTILANDLEEARTKATADDVCDHESEEVISVECDW